MISKNQTISLMTRRVRQAALGETITMTSEKLGYVMQEIAEAENRGDLEIRWREPT